MAKPLIRDGAVNVHVQQHSAAVDAALQGHMPELQVTTPHTSIIAKGVAGVLAVVVAGGVLAAMAHLPERPPTPVPGPALPPRAAMSEAEVRELARTVADQTGDRVERMMDAKLATVRAEVHGLRAAVDRVEANQTAVLRGSAALQRGP